MKKLLIIVASVVVLGACNAKEVGESITRGIDNVVEGTKDAPQAIGDASNKGAAAGEKAVSDEKK